MAERNYLSIGQVVNLLRGAYPDLSNSKIRFLEDEGLITPHRTPKGYRQYSKEDVDRLEVILHLQKTRYMPLNVIKQRLENATDLSTLAYEVGLLSDVPLKTEPKETKQKLHPIETIPDMLGVEISFIRSLAENDLIRIIKSPQNRELVDGRDFPIIRYCSELSRFHIEPRNLRQYVSSANVACGWHAGDPMVMDKVVRMAKERGVMVGAHPGYPDMMGFGRRKMVLSHDEIKNYVRYQIGALAAFTKSYGMKLQHVAPHGAMGNACQYDEDIASAIVEAICEYDKDLIVYYCAGAVLGDIAESKGLRTASEIFADRAYMDDLSLVPRKMEGSMITDEDIAIQRCVKMIKEGKVTSITGKELDIKGDTLCVHGDGPKALAFVQKIREKFTEEGIEIRHL